MTSLKRIRPNSQRSKATALAVTACLVSSGLFAANAEQSPDYDVDDKRVPLYTVMPDYPTIARRDRIQGEVQVCFEITRDGRTRRIAVRKSTHRLFEKPAIRAVRESSYVPIADDAVLSGIKSCRTFRFTLEPTVVETDGPAPVSD